MRKNYEYTDHIRRQPKVGTSAVVCDLPCVVAQLREVWVNLYDEWLRTSKWRLIKRMRAEARMEQAWFAYHLAEKAFWGGRDVATGCDNAAPVVASSGFVLRPFDDFAK